MGDSSEWLHVEQGRIDRLLAYGRADGWWRTSRKCAHVLTRTSVLVGVSDFSDPDFRKNLQVTRHLVIAAATCRHDATTTCGFEVEPNYRAEVLCPSRS